MVLYVVARPAGFGRLPMPRPADHLPPPPPSLSEEHGTELTALAEQALRRERRERDLAIDAAFEHIPRALRGVVRRALGA